MIVTCQNCEANFNLNDDLVKKTGSKVRCSKCKHVFVIYPKAEALEEEIPAAAAGVEKPPELVSPISETVAPIAKGKMDLGDSSGGISFPGGDLDLSEVEKMLATNGQGELEDLLSIGKEETPPPSGPLPRTPSVSPAIGLDLSEIEQMLETDHPDDDDHGLREPEPEDLVFDMGDAASRPISPKEVVEYDIADIEKMLEVEMVEDETGEAGGLLYQPSVPLSSEPAVEEITVETDDEPFDFSEIDDMMETDGAVRKEVTSENKEEELFFEMETADTSAKSDVTVKSVSTVDEIDFGELSDLIKTDDLGESDKVGREEEEEELTLALDSDDAFVSPPVTAKVLKESELPDLSNLDQLLDEKEGLGTDDELALEIDLADISPAPSKPDKVDDEELDLQFDKADVDDSAVGDTDFEAKPGQPLETEDLDLEFDEKQLNAALAVTEEITDGPDSSERLPEEDLESRASNADSEGIYPGMMDGQPAEEKSSKKALVWVVILVLVVGAAVAGYLSDGFGLFGKSGIQIPFISKGKQPGAMDTGNLKITAIDIESRFVETAAGGKLFVITGKARNGYEDPRNFIRVTGKLYTKGKQLVSSETVFCGNVIPAQDLAKLTLEEIKSRLANRRGENDSNVAVKPGEERPFMVVFSKLTENLEEFTIEVAGSEPAQKKP